jgi:hypothetical protein
VNGSDMVEIMFVDGPCAGQVYTLRGNIVPRGITVMGEMNEVDCTAQGFVRRPSFNQIHYIVERQLGVLVARLKAPCLKPVTER